MKKIFLSLAAFLVTHSLIAQDNAAPKPPTSKDRLKQFSEMVDKELKVSGLQKEKLLDAYKVFFAKMDELHTKYPAPPPPPAPPAEMKAEMDKLVAEKDKAAKEALTPEQFSKLKEMENKHRRDHEMMPPPPPPPAVPGS